MDDSHQASQIQKKLHFHKTARDLPIYNIHKRFEAYDASELRVDEIINTLFHDCEDKKYAQMCAQTYICHRIIDKAKEFRRTAIFYQDPYFDTKSLYEEPLYVLVKYGIADTAQKILRRPLIFLLKRCSEILRKTSRRGRRKIKEKQLKQKKEKQPKQKKEKQPKQKKGKKDRSLFDESLRAIVGKFPTLMIPKLTPQEIEYHMKAKFRTFDPVNKKRQSISKRKKHKALKKTKYGREDKENSISLSKNKRGRRKRQIVSDADVRKSTRISMKKKETLHLEEVFQNDYKFSVISEAHLQQEDDQQVQNNFQHYISKNVVESLPCENDRDIISLPCEDDEDIISLPREDEQDFISLPREDEQDFISLPREDEQDFISKDDVESLPHEDNQDVISLPCEDDQGVISLPCEDDQGVISLSHEGDHSIISLPHEGDQGVISLSHEGDQGIISLPHEGDQGIISLSREGDWDIISEDDVESLPCEDDRNIISKDDDSDSVVEIPSQEEDIISQEQSLEANFHDDYDDDSVVEIFHEEDEIEHCDKLQKNSSIHESIEGEVRNRDGEKFQSGVSCTLEEIFRNDLYVSEDNYIYYEHGLDMRVVNSLKKIYENVHGAKNNYIFCNRIY